MVVGLAADGDVSLPDLDLADGPSWSSWVPRATALLPGRRDLRPAVSIPMALVAGVAQRRRGRLGRALRDRAGAPARQGRAPAGHGVRRRPWCSPGSGSPARWWRRCCSSSAAARRGGRRARRFRQPGPQHRAVLHTGPVLPRRPTSTPGAWSASTSGSARPTRPRSTTSSTVTRCWPASRRVQVEGHRRGPGMAVDAAVRGAVVGLLPVGSGCCSVRSAGASCGRVGLPEAVTGVVVVTLLGLAVWQPWTPHDDPVQSGRGLESPRRSSVPDVPVPTRRRHRGARRRHDGVDPPLIQSAVSTYDASKTFYAAAAVAEAADLPLRDPRRGETVVAFVSDRPRQHRHGPGRASVADAAGATAV